MGVKAARDHGQQAQFLLSPSGDGTSLVQDGTYRGLRGPGTYARGAIRAIGRIQGTFESINQAIKEQAEARQRTPG